MIRARVLLVQNRFPQIATRLHSGSAEKGIAAAEQVQQEAKAVVPVRTGNLRDHIAVETYEGYTTAMVHTSGVPYAARVEYGFVGYDSLGRYYNQAPRPYLTPAAELVRPRFIDEMSNLEPMLA
mgnify:CR=1 FL=1